MENVTWTISSGFAGALCGLAAAWIRARYNTTKIEPNPLKIDESDAVRFRRDKLNIYSRISVLEQRVSMVEGKMEFVQSTLERIEGKIDRMLVGNKL